MLPLSMSGVSAFPRQLDEARAAMVSRVQAMTGLNESEIITLLFRSQRSGRQASSRRRSCSHHRKHRRLQ